MTTPFRLALLAALALAASMPAQGQAHEHGAARLDVAVEGNKLSLQLEAPLNSLFGFERAPRNATERLRVDTGVAALTSAIVLFQPDPAAGCTLDKVELNSAALALGKTTANAPPGEHADLDASITFSCKDTAQLGFIDLRLFYNFAPMQRIDVQIALPKGQLKRTLKRPASRITFAR